MDISQILLRETSENELIQQTATLLAANRGVRRQNRLDSSSAKYGDCSHSRLSDDPIRDTELVISCTASQSHNPCRVNMVKETIYNYFYSLNWKCRMMSFLWGSCSSCISKSYCLIQRKYNSKCPHINRQSFWESASKKDEP